MHELTDASREAIHKAGLMSPEDLANYLGVPLATIYRWRTRREGPRGLKVGKHVRYRPVDVDAWLEKQADRPVA